MGVHSPICNIYTYSQKSQSMKCVVIIACKIVNRITLAKDTAILDILRNSCL